MNSCRIIWLSSHTTITLYEWHLISLVAVTGRAQWNTGVLCQASLMICEDWFLILPKCLGLSLQLAQPLRTASFHHKLSPWSATYWKLWCTWFHRYLQTNLWLHFFLRFLPHKWFNYEHSLLNHIPITTLMEFRLSNKNIWASRTFNHYCTDHNTYAV